MSLVAGYTVGSVPLLVASPRFARTAGNGASGNGAGAASSVDLLAQLPDEYGVGLRVSQRLALINNFLAVAWAGPQPAAVFVVRQLRKLAGDQPLPAKVLDAFLKAIDKDKHLSQLCLVGIRVESPDRAVLFSRGMNEGELPGPSAGSSLHYFSEDLGHEYFRLIASRMLEAAPVRGELPVGLSIANSAASEFLRRDVNIERQIQLGAASSMLPLAAGSYEIAVFEDGRLRKVGSVTQFWRARLDDRTVDFEVPCLVVRRDYEGTTLLLRWSWAERHSKQVILPMARQQCVAIGTAEDDPASLEVERRRWPGFNAETETHAVLMSDASGTMRIATLTHQCATEIERDIRYADQPDSGWTRGRLSLATPGKIAKLINGAARSN